MVIGLARFSNYEYLIDGYNQEYLYFSTINEIRNNELGKNYNYRYDKYENVDQIYPQNKIQLILDGKQINLGEGNNPVLFIQGGKNYYTHICCFNIIEKDDSNFNDGDSIIDEKMFDFGNAFFLITQNNVNSFIELIDNTLRKDQKIIKFNYGKVEYKDIKNHSGDWGIWRKDIKFEFQNEFRIVFQSTEKNAVKLSIPNLRKFIGKPFKVETLVNKIIKGNLIIN
jgi:hypothetical protein